MVAAAGEEEEEEEETEEEGVEEMEEEVKRTRGRRNMRGRVESGGDGVELVCEHHCCARRFRLWHTQQPYRKQRRQRQNFVRVHAQSQDGEGGVFVGAGVGEPQQELAHTLHGVGQGCVLQRSFSEPAGHELPSPASLRSVRVRVRVPVICRVGVAVY